MSGQHIPPVSGIRRTTSEMSEPCTSARSSSNGVMLLRLSFEDLSTISGKRVEGHLEEVDSEKSRLGQRTHIQGENGAYWRLIPRPARSSDTRQKMYSMEGQRLAAPWIHNAMSYRDDKVGRDKQTCVQWVCVSGHVDLAYCTAWCAELLNCSPYRHCLVCRLRVSGEWYQR